MSKAYLIGLRDRSPWNSSDQGQAEDLIEAVGDGFDWHDGMQYGMCIVLQRALLEIDRLAEERSAIVRWLREPGQVDRAEYCADAIERGEHLK